MERIKTGITALDTSLQGGLPEGAAILIAGLPGVGKSIMANQISFFNADDNNKVVYMSTLSEPQVKILKFQQEFTFFDYNKFQKSVIYYDLGGILRRKDFAQTLTVIDELLRLHQPRLIVIDTIKTLTDMIPSILDFREFLLDLSLKMATWGCTTILLGEYTEDEILNRPESAIVDGIIYLYGTEEKRQQHRYMRTLKMRGTNIPGGEIRYRISPDGINIYPRLNPIVNEQHYYQSTKRLSTGIPGLDEMMGGGIPTGSTTLLSGASGTGKTILAIYMAAHCLKENEAVLYITFEENPKQIINGMKNQGFDLDKYIGSGQLSMIHVSPMELNVDELSYHIQRKANEMKAGMVIIDSISSFEVGMDNKSKYTDCIWALADYLKAAGIAALFIHEIHDSHLVSEVTKHGISFVADNIILLRFLEEGTNVKRYLRIVKMRCSGHLTKMKELHISAQGVSLGETL